MARGQSVYQGAYNFPVQSTAAQSIMQGAQAQAQMYSSLGQALGKVANTYFEKKDEDKQIDLLVQDKRILDAIYQGREQPTDPKEIRKDVQAHYKGLGGREGVELHLGRMQAEQRAQEGAARLKRAEDRIIQMEEDTKSYFKSLTERPDVTSTETREGEMFPKGGTIGDRLPGLKPQQMGEPSPSAYIPTVPQRNVVTGEVTQPQGEPSYFSKLKSGIRTAREKLADVEMPKIPLTDQKTTTRPGQSLLARSTEMTGPAFLETWAERNPNATVGMMELARQSAAGLPQREAMQPVLRQEGNLQWLENPRTGEPLSQPMEVTQTGKIGFEARDVAFAKTVDETNVHDVSKSLEQLKLASDALAKSDTLTGPWVSMLPEWATSRLNPEATNVREAVEEVVQRNLRLVLGAQFTEKEGTRLIERAFNPRLGEKENKKRVDRLFKQIKGALDEHLKKRVYFDEHGTLRGHSGITTEEIRKNLGLSPDTGATGNLNLTSDQIVERVTRSADWANASPETKRQQIEKIRVSDASSPEIKEKAIRILEEGLPEEPPPTNGEDKGADVMEIAAQIGDGEEAQEFKMRVPTVKGLKSGKLSGEIGGFIEVLSNVMREAIETGAIPRDEFAGPDNVWYGEFPDPLRQENYEKLIVYAKESLNKLGSRAAARNMGTTPSPTDSSLFDYLKEFATILGG